MPGPAAPACAICAKHLTDDGLRVLEDDLVVVSHLAPAPGGEAHLGYLFVELRRHADGLGALTGEEAAAVGRTAASAARALESALGAEHVYAAVIGHGIAHFHLHVIARHPGTPREFWFERVDEWPEGPRGDLDRLRELTARLAPLLRDRT